MDWDKVVDESEDSDENEVYMPEEQDLEYQSQEESIQVPEMTEDTEERIAPSHI